MLLMLAQQNEHSETFLATPNEIKKREDYWKLKNGEFLLYHPKGARWMMNGLLWLGTANLLIFTYILYIKLSSFAAFILLIITVGYFHFLRKQVSMFNKNKTLTIYDMYLKKN